MGRTGAASARDERDPTPTNGDQTTLVCQYDNQGNTIWSGSQLRWQHKTEPNYQAAGDRLMSYDAAGRLLTMNTEARGSVACGSTTVPHNDERHFQYDGLGRRVVMVSTNSCAADFGTTRYFWLDNQVAVRVYNAGIDTARTHDGGAPLRTADEIWPQVASATVTGMGQWFYYGPRIDHPLASRNEWVGQSPDLPSYTRVVFLQDAHGSVVRGLCPDATPATCGSTVSHYSAFGTSEGGTGTGANGGTQPGYHGAEAAGGLVYLRNRWYDPNTGRFTQEDPIGYAGGINLYGYTGNDPVNYSDPFGLCPDALKDQKGLCPGGLTDKEWDEVKAEIPHMSAEASARTTQLLNEGRIHGKVLKPDQAGRVNSNTPRDIDINRRSKYGDVFDSRELGPTIVHEGRHVEQLKGHKPGRDAASYMERNKQKLEDDANNYERANYKKP